MKKTHNCSEAGFCFSQNPLILVKDMTKQFESEGIPTKFFFFSNTVFCKSLVRKER